MIPDELLRAAVTGLGPSTRATTEYGLLTADVPPGNWLTALRAARDRLDCDFFDWLSAVDEPPGAIDVVCHLWSTAGHHHLLLRTRCPAGEPRLPSATGVFRGAGWHERETWEMFGVVFDGHPGLVPLLLPDGFEGHPLRKDFVLAARVVKEWPGRIEPGRSGPETGRRRRPKQPLGVPEPGTWGPAAVPGDRP